MTPNRWDLSKSKRKLDELADVLVAAGRKPVLILCHINPDPDSIAAASSLSFLLKKNFGVRSIVGYGGVITRAENKAMVQRLRIRMKQLSQVDHLQYPGIAVVDAQPGTGNTLLESRGTPPLIVIDHHPLRKLSLKAAYHDIRPSYGATSTILTEYLVAADLTPTRSLANALLYGIKTDTHSLMRGSNRVDFDAFKFLTPMTNPRVLGWIENPSLSPEHFVDYSKGLLRTNLYRDVAISYLGRINSSAIIPELADLFLRIEGICWSLCMGKMKDLMFLSIRSTSRTYRAGNVARRLVGRMGSAGGHREMAAGQILLDGMTDEEVEDLPQRLVERFLGLINRDGITPWPLVENERH